MIYIIFSTTRFPVRYDYEAIGAGDGKDNND